jgi:histidine triad (HIT) family protein
VDDNGPCPFCELFAQGIDPEWQWHDTIILTPLDAVVPGHVLVIPRTHVQDFAEDPVTSALVMGRAAQLVQGYARDGADFNIITSIGPAATQTVNHLHVHIVPRTLGDGLKLPWTGQIKEREDGSR